MYLVKQAVIYFFIFFFIKKLYPPVCSIASQFASLRLLAEGLQEGPSKGKKEIFLFLEKTTSTTSLIRIIRICSQHY